MKFSWVFVGSIVLVGVIGGALSGLLGIGSGIIMVPILSTMWQKQPDAQKIAQGTALAVMVPMTVAGALSYHFGGQSGNFRVTVPIFVWSLLIGLIALAIPLRCSSLLCVTNALGHVRWDYVALLAVGGVIGSTWLGAPLANALPADLLKKIFGIFIIIVGLRMTGFYAWLGAMLTQRAG
ncbi:MAG: TSUP family transporter [Armatimonadota bacterium]